VLPVGSGDALVGRVSAAFVFGDCAGRVPPRVGKFFTGVCTPERATLSLREAFFGKRGKRTKARNENNFHHESTEKAGVKTKVNGAESRCFAFVKIDDPGAQTALEKYEALI